MHVLHKSQCFLKKNGRGENGQSWNDWLKSSCLPSFLSVILLEIMTLYSGILLMAPEHFKTSLEYHTSL